MSILQNEPVKSKVLVNEDRKCGDITFCIQLGKRVYALNCLYCHKIYLQWDTFINHIEQAHNEDLNIDYMLLQENDEKKDDINESFLNDPLENKNSIIKDTLKESAKIEKMDISTAELPNSLILNRISDDDDINVSDNDNKDENLSDEVSSQSSLYFQDENDNKKIICDKTKLTELIIKYYKKHKVLWQTNLLEHKSIMKHHEAYQNITNLINREMNLNLKCIQIKGKINKLRNKFRKEHELAIEFSEDSSKNLKNEEIDYDDLLTIPNVTQSVSWLYDKMIFLKDYIHDGRKRSKRGTKALMINKSYLPLAKLSFEENRKFIDLYKSYPCLWDVNHIGFRFKKQRQESLQELLEAVNTQMNLNLSIEDLQKKLYYIRYAFTQEKHRQLKNEHEFTPQCKLYNELLFLKESVGPFKCEYCDQIFNGPDQYKIHKSSHDGSMPYTCPQCKKGFMKVGNCTVHLRRHTKDFQFECEVCGKKFPTSTDLNVHSRRHTGEKPYFCDICGQSFRTWTYFDSHRRRHEKNPNHKCSICLKGFYEHNKLKQHMKSHLNLRDKVCNICGKSFTCTKYLNQHKLTHAEKKKYSCKMCDKKFAQHGGLSNHIKSHATITNSLNIFDNMESIEDC